MHVGGNIIPSNADGIVSGSSKVKGQELKFGFNSALVGSEVSTSSSLLFCFLLFLLLLLFAGGSPVESIINKENKPHDSSLSWEILENKLQFFSKQGFCKKKLLALQDNLPAPDNHMKKNWSFC